MPDTRHEISEEQGPAAEALEPAVDPVQAILCEVHVGSVLVDQEKASGAADGVADRDSANAARICGGNRGQKLEVPFENQVSGKREQRFVGHRKPDNRSE